MKLFIYEHITSGALIGNTLPKHLAREGNKMLVAVLQDCLVLDGIAPIIMRDFRLPPIDFISNTRCHSHTVFTARQYAKRWQQCLIECEAVLIIAPETDHSLHQLQQQALACDSIILGCQLNAVALTSHKLDCDKYLSRHAINTATGWLASTWENVSLAKWTSGYVVKPIDGAGCTDTFIFNAKTQLERYLLQQEEKKLQRMMIQPYISGLSLSLSLLVSTSDVLVLAINRQMIARKNDTLTLNACIINDFSHSFSLQQATILAQQIQRAIIGLWGFVGVDIVLNQDNAVVVDVNPRLTSSYIGLRASLGLNPMELLLKMKQQGMAALPVISQRKKVDIAL